MATTIDIDLPPVVMRVAGQIERGVLHLSPVESIAAVVVSTGEIREALAALPGVRQLRERHTKRVWGGSSLELLGIDRVEVCVVCNTAWPCEVIETLGEN